MKFKTLIGLGGATGMFITSSHASADYLGLTVDLQTTVTVVGVSRDVYRVYANFTSPDDYVTAVAGSPLLGDMVIQNLNADGTALGSGFFNPGGNASNTAPSNVGSLNYWGTYATIGISDVKQSCSPAGSCTDFTTLTPGFPNFILGNQLTSNNAAWFTNGPVAQGQASFIVDGYDTDLRVQIMQLSVKQGELVAGTVAISVSVDGIGSTFAGQTFGVPAPGVLALLAIRGLVGARRRY